MNAYNWAITYGLLPLVDPERSRGLGRRMRRYHELERLSADELLHRQQEALRQMLKHAQATAPFYRKRFASVGLDPAAPDVMERFRALPPITRDDIREHAPEMCSSAFASSELRPSATGGTTDTPARFYRDVESLREKTAAQAHFDTWAGFYPGTEVFYLWGAVSDYPQSPSWRWRLYDRSLMRRTWAATSQLSEQVLESHRQELNRSRAKVIYAYPTPLTIFCEFLRAQGKPYHRPASVICTAEALLPEQRELIQAVLGCPVFEQYGSREFGMIAAECEEHSGLHVNPLCGYLEYIPVEGSEDGLQEILVTDLLNRGMPLLRYRVNDCTRPGPTQCSCGRGFPLMQPIIGRWSDIFQLADGTKIPGVALTNRVLQVCPGLKKTQVVQNTHEDFVLRYVPGEGFAPADLETLRVNLLKFFPVQVRWSFEAVADIPRESSGKTRFCISHVGRNASAAVTVKA